jgi:Leucine Rich Repeat
MPYGYVDENTRISTSRSKFPSSGNSNVTEISATSSPAASSTEFSSTFNIVDGKRHKHIPKSTIPSSDTSLSTEVTASLSMFDASTDFTSLCDKRNSLSGVASEDSLCKKKKEKHPKKRKSKAKKNEEILIFDENVGDTITQERAPNFISSAQSVSDIYSHDGTEYGFRLVQTSNPERFSSELTPQIPDDEKITLIDSKVINRESQIRRQASVGTFVTEDFQSCCNDTTASSFGDGLTNKVNSAGVYNDKQEGETAPHDLMIKYMMSMGADMSTAEQLADNFTTQQRHISGVKTKKRKHKERQLRCVPNTYLEKEAELDRYNSSMHNGIQQDPSVIKRSLTCPERSYYDELDPSGKALETVEVIHSSGIYNKDYNIPGEDSPKSRSVRSKITTILIFLLCGILGVALYLTVLKKKTTAALTMSPSLSPSGITRDVLLKAQQLSGKEAISDETSPQYKAAYWISMNDTPKIGNINDVFTQRYAMIVLYYGLNGQDWTEKDNWLNPLLHECEWSTKITCSFQDSSTRLVTALTADRNNLLGSIPTEIELLTSLESLNVSSNQITGNIPSSIGNLTSLLIIDFSQNAIEGVIPTTMGLNSQMIQIQLSGNNLSSTIPTEILSFSNLVILNVSRNAIFGSIPSQIGLLTELKILDFSSNALTGTLPSEIGNLSALQTLHLNDNQLIGTLPLEVKNWAQLQSLNISANKFIGNISDQLSSLKPLI